MATHDYVLDNASGAAFRTDLNNALAAIVSNNSNSSSPATTYAYQWWADTSAGVLKIRNSANNAWIELLQLDGTLTLEDGSVSTPALAFRDDLNTGIFSSAADTFNVATGGVERMELGATTIFNEDGADVDFRIEGDTEANLFYVDAGNNNIGIGTSSPSRTLDVNGFIRSDGTSGGLSFGGNSSTPSEGSSIHRPATDSLAFVTGSNERMRIDSSGNLLHGVTSSEDTTGNSGTKLITAGDLQIDGDQKALVFRSTSTTAQKLSGIQWWNETGAGVQCAIFGIRETTTLAKGALAFYTSDSVDTASNNGEGNITERMRIDSSGRLLIGLTTSATTDSNAHSRLQAVTTAGPNVFFGRDDSDTADNSRLGVINFGGNHGGTYHEIVTIRAAADAQHASNSKASRLEFYTTSSGNTQASERMRISKDGDFMFGQTTQRPAEFNTPDGLSIRGDTKGQIQNTVSGQNCLFNRKGSDGAIIGFRQDGSDEGSISVSGSTVSYNGGHLSRWSQLKGISTTDKSARPTIYQGTVMSNLDELCEWKHDDILYQEDVLYTDADTIPDGKKVGDVKHAKGSVFRAAHTEQNQQLNMTKISDTEGEKDVAGVFWAWDDDDDEIVNDFYVAMTGDMVIRVAASTTVARGDLLISAGDGTAKPQDDDIVRSSTIAKIISTNHTATYADGSKAYPCVLMAC